MVDRRCCCGCYEFTDDFGRSDSTDVGDNWEEVHGDWEIKSNKLYEPGTTGAKLRSVPRVPERSEGEMHVAVTAVEAVADQTYILYAAWDDEADTYYKSIHKKLDAVAGGPWETTLYKGAVLLDTATQTPLPYPDNDHVRCYICLDRDGFVKAGVLSGNEFAWAVETGGLTGRKFGVGHSNSIDTYMDDFIAEELHTSTESCYECFCTCCTNGLASTLVATIDDAIDRAACLDGQSVELDYDWDGGLQTWQGTLTVSGNDFALTLGCDATADPDCTGQNIYLTIESNCARIGGTTCTAGCTVRPTASSSCEPALMLVFGPFEYGNTMIACTACYPSTVPPTGPATGSYYIVVTE